MFEILENIRQKPVGTRKRIAFFTALCFALILLAIWMTVVYPDMNQSQAVQARVGAATPSPWSAFSDSISSGFSAMGSQFGELKNTVSSFTPGPTVYTATTTP